MTGCRARPLGLLLPFLYLPRGVPAPGSPPPLPRSPRPLLEDELACLAEAQLWRTLTHRQAGCRGPVGSARRPDVQGGSAGGPGLCLQRRLSGPRPVHHSGSWRVSLSFGALGLGWVRLAWLSRSSKAPWVDSLRPVPGSFHELSYSTTRSSRLTRKSICLLRKKKEKEKRERNQPSLCCPLPCGRAMPSVRGCGHSLRLARLKLIWVGLRVGLRFRCMQQD